MIFLNIHVSKPGHSQPGFLVSRLESFYVLQWFMFVDAGLPRQGGTNPDDLDDHGRYGALVAWWRWIKKGKRQMRSYTPDTQGAAMSMDYPPIDEAESTIIWNGVQRTLWLKHLTIRHRTWSSLWVKYLWTKASIRYSPIQAALLNRWVDSIAFLYYCKAPGRSWWNQTTVRGFGIRRSPQLN